MSRAALLGKSLHVSAQDVIVTCGPILARALESLRAGNLERLELAGGEVVTASQLHEARMALLKLAQDCEGG